MLLYICTQQQAQSDLSVCSSWIIQPAKLQKKSLEIRVLKLASSGLQEHWRSRLLNKYLLSSLWDAHLIYSSKRHKQQRFFVFPSSSKYSCSKQPPWASWQYKPLTTSPDTGQINSLTAIGAADRTLRCCEILLEQYGKPDLQSVPLQGHCIKKT